MARILVVDDEEGIRSLVAETLDDGDHDVATAADGDEPRSSSATTSTSSSPTCACRAAAGSSCSRIGGTRALTADVRWIAATHRDLRAMIEAGRFREDLYHRLAVFPIRCASAPATRRRSPARCCGPWPPR